MKYWQVRKKENAFDIFIFKAESLKKAESLICKKHKEYTGCTIRRTSRSRYDSIFNATKKEKTKNE